MPPQIGENDEFEFTYRPKLDAILAPKGLLLGYTNDRAALDLGVHFYTREGDKTVLGGARVWIQAKGLRASTLPEKQMKTATSISVGDLSMEDVRYWYNSPEPVYLVVYVEAVDAFFAEDVRVLVEDSGGLTGLLATGHKTVTLKIPVSQTIERALERMPRHRSMRIDGKAWRGRPLGHGFDPLRSALAPMAPELFFEVMRDLLTAHDFRPGLDGTADTASLADTFANIVPPTAFIGRLHLTYEWVLPMMTEYGYGEDTDFRIEGEPFHAHGDVVVVIDPTGSATPDSMSATLAPVLKAAEAIGIRRVMLFANGQHDPGTFGSWFRLAPGIFECAPQDLDSLAFNVLTTTNVYLSFHDRIALRFVNYL